MQTIVLTKVSRRGRAPNLGPGLAKIPDGGSRMQGSSCLEPIDIAGNHAVGTNISLLE